MRGGARKGAGRKAGSIKTDNRKKISITLPIKIYERLRVKSKEQSLSQAKIVEKALVEWLNKDGV